MAVIKCKMCGGDLDISEGLSVCECEYCGTKQTVPSADNEKKLTLFARANRLRLANEFDKAEGVYESIVADFPEEAEAYWGLVLCKYGIEYVDDPATGKKIPTCHRSSFDVVLDDPNFEQACENADAVARRQYREEAKELERIRQGIVELSGREEPYDVFICYKETDENGDRTVDSVIAQDVYDALTERGYRVFFSRISLEDKLGIDYEPYIFAALNSAKLMLAFGTDFEYFEAVWVKNEWSRFLKLMEKDKSKHLIPCYKDLDPYDMPKEFRRLQAQDMGKVGAVQDLLRGVEKLLPRKQEYSSETHQVIQQVVQGGGPNANALLQRGQLALEDSEWNKAKEFFDQVLNMDAQSAEAYLGLALSEIKLHKEQEIGSISRKNRIRELEDNSYFKKYLRFASDERKQKSFDLIKTAKENMDEQINPINGMISAGYFHTVGVRQDGTVLSVGANEDGRCSVSRWRDIIAVSAGFYHTLGLHFDGTVSAVGGNASNQCDTGSWRDITAISAGGYHSVGLCSNGAVLSTGSNGYGQCGVSGWRRIISICAGIYHTVGLCNDGTVLAVGRNDDGQCNVSEWRQIVAIAAGDKHTVGLRADGTVVATGKDDDGRCNVWVWNEIVAIAAGNNHTIGLRSDGRLIATGDNEYGMCIVDGWKDVVAIDGGYSHTIGLCMDGTVVAIGANGSGQCNVNEWKLFNSIDTLEETRAELMKEKERERQEVFDVSESRLRIAKTASQTDGYSGVSNADQERLRLISSLNEEKRRLNNEFFNLKGVFTGKRRREIEARLSEIDVKLRSLQ